MFNLYSALSSLLLSLNPLARVGRIPAVVINRAVMGMLSTHSGSVMGTNAMSDISSGTELGANLARLFGAFGLGTIAAPWLGNRALRAGGHAAVYRVRALVALVHLLHNAWAIPETLAAAAPAGARRQGLNPFGFGRLLLRPDGPLLSRLLRAVAVCTSEQKILINLKTLWLREDVGLSIDQAQRELMAYAGATCVSGQVLAPRLIAWVGPGAFTDLTAALNAIAFVVWGLSPTRPALWGGLLLHAPGCNGTGACAVKADMMSRAEELGIGKAEMNAYFMNLRALLVVFVPLLLARVYSALAPRGSGGRAWLLLAAFSAASLAPRA